MMKITIKREQKQAHLGLAGVSNLRGAGAKTKGMARRLLLLPALVGFALASCVNEREYDIPSPERGDDATITFALNVPGNSAPATRGLSENDETNVETIDVLLFRKNGSDRLYWDKLQGVSLDNTPGSTKRFTAVIPIKDYSNYDITIVANAREIILGAGLTRGDSKADVLNKLVLDISGKWESNKIPMWGEALNVDVNENTNLSGSNAVKMTRMISRIDVKLSQKAATGSDDPPGTDNANFALVSVRLYNYSTKGTVVPDFDNPLSWGDKAITPHQPASGYGEERGPLVYTMQDQHISDDNMPDSLIRSIYTLEAPAGDNASLSTNTCLVIGGKYQGGGKETFYRIDFAVKDEGTQQYEYLHLLRNHNYIVNITEITGPGFETPEEAFLSRPINIEAGILYWNDGGMGQIAFDGQNFLALSQGSFEFTRGAIDVEREDNVLYVKTDVPEGWSIEKIVNADDEEVDWVELAPDSGDAGDKTKVVLTVTENDTSQTRSAIIWIVAGRLRYPVTVTQTLASALGIQLTDGQGKPVTELLFTNKTPIPSQTLNVYWQPKSADLTIVNTTPVGAVAFPTGEITYSGSNGKHEYIITPSAFSPAEIASNPFLEKVSKIDFTTTNGIDKANESVSLRQVNYTVVPVGVPRCLLSGDTYSFKIRSNTAWQIESVTGKPSDGSSPLLSDGHTGDNMKMGHSGGNNITVGDEIRFTVVDDIAKTLSGTIEVVFTSPTQLFEPVTVTIEIVNDNIWARSNIVWIEDSSLPSKGILTFAVTPTDNTTGRTITVGARSVPVQAIPASSQGVFFKWGSLVAISPAALNGTTAGYTPGYYYDSSQGHILYSPTGTYNYAYTGIPYFDPTSYGSGIWSNNIPEEDDFATYNNSKGYDASDRGDICRYISAMGWVEGNWRLPTGAEIADLLVQKRDAGDWANTNVAPANSGYGFYAPQGGSWLGEGAAQSTNKVSPEYGIFVPASGARGSTNGSANLAGSGGFFWSGSSYGDTDGYYLYVYFGNAIQNLTNRELGFPVRCVRIQE